MIIGLARGVVANSWLVGSGFIGAGAVCTVSGLWDAGVRAGFVILFPELGRPTAGIEISRIGEESQLVSAQDEVVSLYVQEVERGPRLSEAE